MLLMIDFVLHFEPALIPKSKMRCLIWSTSAVGVKAAIPITTKLYRLSDETETRYGTRQARPLQQF